MVARRIQLACVWIVLGLAGVMNSRSELALGPLYNKSGLVLESGWREEMAGPLFYREQRDSVSQLAFPPIFSITRDPDVESVEIDFLYPVASYDRFGSEYRVHFGQLFSFAGGNTQEEKLDKRFTLFPFYFQQRGQDSSRDYTAVLPFYGTLKNRLFRDRIHFVMFPAYVQTQRKDVVTDNYMFPIVHKRHGNQLEGWQIWPFAGAEHKDPITITNQIDELEVIGGHDKSFVMWPFYLHQNTGIGTANPATQFAMLPFFSTERSPQRDSTSIPWPLGVTVTDDRARKFHEVGAPWPLVVYARGEGKTTTRFWPFFSEAHNANLQSDFYLWPVYKYNRFRSDPAARERTRIFYFLYSDVIEINTESGDARRRTDLWPLFTHRKDYEGQERLQLFSILEPLLPNNKSVDRNHAPVYSIWRSEKNPKTHAASESFLWNLYRHDVNAATNKASLLFGLFQYQSTPAGKSGRILGVPLGKTEKSAPPKP